jgi:hypothetical protein
MKDMNVSNRDDQLDESSRLLMYAVGELPEAESAAMSRRLVADDALADRLSAIRAALQDADDAFSAADATQADPRASVRAKASALQTVRAWQAARSAKATKPAAKTRQRGTWAAPVAAAAAIAVLLMGGYVINRMLQPLVRPGYLAESVTLPDLPDPFHFEQVARLAGDERPADGEAAAVASHEAGVREERSAALSEAVAIAAPLTDDPVLSFEVPLDLE